MKANKQLLNRTGQAGLLLVVSSAAVSVAVGGVAGFICLLTAFGGLHLMTHQDFSLKEFFSVGKREEKP